MDNISKTSQKKLLWHLLPGFIPLFVFIIADEIWGTKTGLIVAVIFGVAELAYYRIKDGRIDKFILLDTLLIVILGVVSIVLENEVFFKIKPALIGVLMCVILGVSAYASGNILLNMSKRYMKGVSFNDQQMLAMKKSMRSLFWLYLGYTLLVFYSVWFMSNEAWAFISGGLFYILFAIYFLFEFIKTRLRIKRGEVLRK